MASTSPTATTFGPLLSTTSSTTELEIRIEALKHFLTKWLFFHLIALADTKLGPIVDDSILVLKKYTLVRQDRTTTVGGNTLFVRNSLTVSRLCSSSGKWTGKSGNPEYLFWEVTSTSLSPIFAGVVYRPPHGPFLAGEDNNFMTDLVDTMHN